MTAVAALVLLGGLVAAPAAPARAVPDEATSVEVIGTTSRQHVGGLDEGPGGDLFVAGDSVGTHLDGRAGTVDDRYGWVARRNADGTPVWLTEFTPDVVATDTDTLVRDVAVDQDRQTYVVGTVVAAAGTEEVGFLAAFDADGDERWTRLIGDAATVALGVAVAPDGDVLVAGRSADDLVGANATAGVDGFVQRYSADGIARWSTRLDLGPATSATAVDVAATGATYAVGAGDHAFVARLADDGTIEWSRTLQGGTGTGRLHAVVAADGAVFAAGTTSGDLGRSPWADDAGEVLVASLSPDGSERWVTAYGGAGAQAARRIDVVGDRVVVAGTNTGTVDGWHASTPPTPVSPADGFVTELDGNGARRWTIPLPSASGDVGVGGLVLRTTDIGGVTERVVDAVVAGQAPTDVTGGPTSPANGYVLTVDTEQRVPVGLQAVTSRGQVDLRWLPVPDATGYRVQYRLRGSGPDGLPLAWTERAVAEPTTSVGGLAVGQAHEFRIAAVRDGTTGRWSSVLHVGAGGRPGGPSNFVARPVGTDGLRLTWEPPTDDGGFVITGYRLEWRRLGSPDAEERIVEGAGPHDVTVTGIVRGATYQVQVTALSAFGDGVTLSTAATVPLPSGYWLMDADGTVYHFGEARPFGDPSTDLHRPAVTAGGTPGGFEVVVDCDRTGCTHRVVTVTGEPPTVLDPGFDYDAVDLEATPSNGGYWVLDERGVVHPFGDATHHGDVDTSVLRDGEQVATMSRTPTGDGYWVFTDAGRVLPFGAAGFFGDVTGLDLAGPVLDSVATPTGLGYYLLGADGGIFALGDAEFRGSVPGVLPGVDLDCPVVGMAPTPDGSGYWLVGCDGGIFSFGGAPFRGSIPGALPGVTLDAPVSGMVPLGNGYLLVARDGGVFNFSDRAFAGSVAGSVETAVVAISPIS